MQFNPYKPPKAVVKDIQISSRRLPALLAVPIGALAWRGLPFLLQPFPLAFPVRPALMICAAILATSAVLAIVNFCKGAWILQLTLMLIGAVAAILLLSGSGSFSHSISILFKPTFLTFAICALVVFGVSNVVRHDQR